MHIEKCPICKGNGKVAKANSLWFVIKNIWSSFLSKETTCPGCHGEGWLEIYDDIAWRIAGIPYWAGLLAEPTIDDNDLRKAQELIQEHGWDV